MGSKYKGKHVAGNVEPVVDPTDEMTDEEKLERETRGRPTPNDVKEAAERFKDASGL